MYIIAMPVYMSVCLFVCLFIDPDQLEVEESIENAVFQLWKLLKLQREHINGE